MSHPQVVSEVVDHAMCIGCGICSGLCPSEILPMGWLSNGDLAPSVEGHCPPSCSVCLQVCPFHNESPTEDVIADSKFKSLSSIKIDPVVGYYFDTFVGHSLVRGHRVNGASGGMTTWILESLLEKGLIDSVIAIGKSSENDALFKFMTGESSETIRSASGSIYNPVDMSEMIKLINSKANEKRYAIVGLPCFLKGVELAKKTMPRLKRRVCYTLGLTCGHLPNKFYTEYLGELSGIKRDKLKEVNYRSKKNTNRAANFKFIAKSKNMELGSQIPFTEISDVWANGWFGFNACDFCDDVFGELASVSLMDAWLPDYESDTAGTSMLVVRDKVIHSLLLEGAKSRTCEIETASVEQIKSSQKGVIFHKRTLLKGRLYWASLNMGKVPKKRIEADSAVYKEHMWQIRSRFMIQMASKYYWPLSKSKSLNLFRLRMYLLSLPISFSSLKVKIIYLIKHPLIALKKYKSSGK